VERALSGRSGIYDIAVSNQHGKLIALFRGKSHRIRGTVIPVPGKVVRITQRSKVLAPENMVARVPDREFRAVVK